MYFKVIVNVKSMYKALLGIVEYMLSQRSHTVILQYIKVACLLFLLLFFRRFSDSIKQSFKEIHGFYSSSFRNYVGLTAQCSCPISLLCKDIHLIANIQSH